MPVQIRLLNGGIHAKMTLVRSLPGMLPHVPGEAAPGREAIATQNAFIGPPREL